MGNEDQSTRCSTRFARGAWLVLLMVLSLLCHAEAIEMTLDLDVKILPGGQTTCGVIRCLEAGSEPRLRQISEMTIFKTIPGAGSTRRTTVGSVSERRPNVSTLWNGVKVDGAWSGQDASLTLYLAERDDCSTGRLFSCQVRYVDGRGEERESWAQLGRAGAGASRPQVVDTHSASSAQVSAMLQQTRAALDSTRQQLNNRLEDNLRHLENRMEDKIGDLNNALLKLEGKTSTDVDDGAGKRQTSLGVLKDQAERVSSVLRTVKDNASTLEDNVNDILRQSVSVLNVLNSLRQSGSQDFDLHSKNASGEFLNKVLKMLAARDPIRSDQTEADNSHTNLVQETSCRRQDGTYRVVMSGTEPPYLCDSQTDGGGWVVIQRRSSGSVDFFRNWSAYRDGFGSLADDFWLGNERIHGLTSQGKYELMVSLRFEGRSVLARYDSFAVGDEASNYTLALGTYSGSAGYSLAEHSGAQFSTYDRDHDALSYNCARQYHGAWWYGKNRCHASNLNGKWGELHNKGPRWEALTGTRPVDFSEMKIRRLE